MKGQVISWVIFVLSLAVEIYCIYATFTEYDGWAWYAFIAAVAVSFQLSSILHELGHMLFGAIVKIKAVPKFTSWRKFFDAMSCVIKPKTDKNLKPKILFTTCGGLFVNLIFIVLGVVALCVPAVPTYLCAFLAASLYLFTLNALPLNLQSGKTDGLVIAELVKNEDTAKVMLAVLKVQAQVLGGKPIEEVDEKLLFDLPQIREDDINFISLTELRYEYFSAKGDSEQAAKYKARFEELKKEYL